MNSIYYTFYLWPCEWPKRWGNHRKGIVRINPFRRWPFRQHNGFPRKMSETTIRFRSIERVKTVQFFPLIDLVSCSMKYSNRKKQKNRWRSTCATATNEIPVFLFTWMPHGARLSVSQISFRLSQSDAANEQIVGKTTFLCERNENSICLIHQRQKRGDVPSMEASEIYKLIWIAYRDEEVYPELIREFYLMRIILFVKLITTSKKPMDWLYFIFSLLSKLSGMNGSGILARWHRDLSLKFFSP